MNIVVLDGYTLDPGDNPANAIEKLGELTVFDRTNLDQILPRAKNADVILTNKTPLNAVTFSQLPKLKFVSVLATGFNVVDVVAARHHGIAVSNVPIYGTDSVAQHVFAMLLSFIHRPRDHDAAVRAGKWSESGDFSFWLSPLTELSGLTMGIVGFGRIGRRVGKIAAAFGMKVVAYNPSPRDSPKLPDFRWCELEEVFETGDVISLHCPQTELNFGFVNRTLLKKMKPNAILINASRGGLINETDLADALNSEQIAGALLDVVSVEPIRDDNPLLQAKNCLLTPHMAWATVAARKRLMQVTADNIAAFLAGKPINVVN